MRSCSCKVAMKFFPFDIEHMNGFFDRAEPPKLVGGSVFNHDGLIIVFCLVIPDSFYAGFGSPWEPPVPHVLCVRTGPEICPPIVTVIAVDMVNFFPWNGTCHPCNSQSVRKKSVAQKAYFNSSVTP